MKHATHHSKTVVITLLLVAFVGFSSWQPQPKQYQPQNPELQYARLYDTTRPGTNYIDQIDIRLNADSLREAVEAALAAIDVNKLQQDINAALSNVDFKKINEEVEASLKNIDFDKIKADAAQALNKAKLSLERLDGDSIRRELEKIKIEFNKDALKKNMDVKKLAENVRRDVEKAKLELGKSQAELNNYKSFAAELQKDGLIPKGKPFSAELKSGELYINGVKQSKETTEKYRRFYMGKMDFFIHNGKETPESAVL